MNIEELKAALKERDDAIADKLGGIEKILEDHSKKWDTVEEIQSRDGGPGKTAETKQDREHRKVFDAWLRNPRDSRTKQALGDFQDKLPEVKALSVGSSADGGFAVPEEIAREVEKLEIKLSPVRSLVKVVRTSSGDFKQLINIGGADAGWVGETGSRTETSTPQLRERAPTFGEIYAYPKATEWSLDDMFFDVPAWLAGEVAEQFAFYEGDAAIRGNGSNKPTGMLNTAPVTTADDGSPLRDAAAYQYVASSASPDAILPDALISLNYTLNAKYRAGAAWVMNSTTAGAVRKLKDSTNQYLWANSLAAGQPPTLLGAPVMLWEQMDDVGANKFPVAFGNFARGYLLADRTQLRITVDNITTPGYVKFYVRRREGGCPLNNDAIKFLKTV